MVRSTSKAPTVLAAATMALLSSADVVTAQAGFQEIATNFSTNPTGVVLPTICIGDFLVPKTMYTFEPAAANETDVKIYSNPKDLVETGYDDVEGLIYFKFIQEVSEVANDAGVIIRFPPGQLESINTCCSQQVQVKTGFTNIQSLTASTSASLNATFSAKPDSNMTISSSTKAKVNVKVTGSAAIGKIDVTAETEASASINGDITSISCKANSECKIAGSILAPEESSADGDSSIKTTTCEGITVDMGSTCQSKTPTVRVNTGMPLVISGVKENCVGGEDLNGMGGPNDPPTDPPTVSPAPTITATPTLPPTNKPTSKPTAVPTPAPTLVATAGAFHAAKQGVFATAVVSGAALMLLLA